MNSLQELNNYNNSLTYSYTDLRIAGLVFDRTTPTNQSLTVNEGASFSHPIGIEVTEVINHTTSLPTLTINLTAVAGLTINWASLPAGVTATEISAGIWRVSGWTNVAHWDQIKSPTITCPQSIPNAYFGTFTYTATVGYVDGALGAQTKSYTVSVSVLDITLMTNPTTITYAPSATTAITGNPTIINIDATYPGAIFTVVGTPIPNTSVTSFTNSASGGTFNFDNSTKVFTITGTRTQVNTRLNALSVVSNANESDFILNYQLSNNLNGDTDQKNQQLRNSSIEFLSNPSSISVSYIEDNVNYATITGTPQITDASFDGLGTYTVEVYPAVLSTITDMYSTGVGGSQSFNNATKKLTITGNRTQVNSHLNAIQFRPGEDTVSLFTITYKLSLPSPRSTVTYKTQNFVCAQSHDEVSNIGLARSYVSNNMNLIFANNTPQITDLDSIEPNSYTVTLNCSFGQWSYPQNISPLVLSPLVNPISITGSKNEINAKLSLIRFYPNANVSSSGVFTYTQIKNGNLQVSASVALNGSVGTYTGGATYTFTATRTWTPSYEDVMFGKVINLLVIGGGGGGGGGIANYPNKQYQGGGGGGGGQVQYEIAPQYFTPNTTYTITVGNGGVGAISGTYSGGILVGNVPGGTGGTSSALGYSAVGGQPGQDAWTEITPNGGISGGGFNGGDGFNSSAARYGGGGGGGPQTRGSVINATSTRGGIGEFGTFIEGQSYIWGAGGGGGGIQSGGNAASGGSAWAGIGASETSAATSRTTSWNGQTPANPYTTEPSDGSQYYGGGGGGGGGLAIYNGAQGNVGLVRFTVVAR